MNILLSFRWTRRFGALAISTFIVGVFCQCAVRAETAAGRALSFDGTNDYVSVSNSAALNLYPITVMAWVKTSDSGTDRTVINKYVNASYSGYQIELNQGRVRAWYFRDSTNYVWDGGLGLDGGFIANGAWHHVAFTVNASGGKLLVDGVLKDTLAWTGTAGVTTSTQEVRFARYGNIYFRGQLDEMSVWNVALSSNAIAGMFHRRLATNETNLRAYWRLDEGFGSAIADLAPTPSGNNAGTLFGAPAWVVSDAPVAPVVLSRAFSMQTLSGVTLRADVNALGYDTTAWFEWGTNTSYGSTTTPLSVGNASTSVLVTADITGLEQGQTYHYRAVGTNAYGRANSADQSLTQPTYPGPAGVPPLRSSYYDGTVLSSVSYEPRPEWDSAVAMTIEAWVYRHDANRCETILSHDWPGSYWLGFCPKLRFYRGTNYAEVPTPIAAWKWTHVAVSYDGAVARFYINGGYVGARSLSNTGAGKLRTLRLGHNYIPPSFFPSDVFFGNLDEIRLWSVARTAEEIRDGMYREVREPGLAAAFPRGGRIEEVSGLAGYGANVSEQIFGMVPRDLVVPRAAIPPTADGNINLASEYLGADQLVLRYPEEPDTADATAYFIHTTNDLFVGVSGHRRNIAPQQYANTWISLFFDTTHERPPLAQQSQVQLQAFQNYNTNQFFYLNGDGGGAYSQCLSNGQPCVSRSLWQIGEALCGDDVNPPPPCTEFRISRNLLGSWDEFDGVALGHFNYGPFGEETFAPEESYPDSPATWLTMSYGEGSANLPRVQLFGRVLAGLTSSSPPLPGYRVTMFAGGAVYTNLTDSLGRYNFDVPMPTGQVIYVQVPNVAFGRYALPTVGFGIQPILVRTNEVRFGAIPSYTGSLYPLADVDFYIMKPLPPSGITSATPVSPVAGAATRVGEDGTVGDIVTIYGTNLHAEVEFYLSPYTDFINPPQWTLLRANVVEIAPDRTWVKVQTPYVPEQVRIFSGSYMISSFQSNWRWVSYDRWTRTPMITYTWFGNFPIQRPAYPLMHGFGFDNRGATPSFNEFLACYDYRAYYCVGCCGYCATHVPDPAYWVLWWPIFREIIGSSGGSCVGMSGTSLQIYHGVFSPPDFDPLAITAVGIDNPGFPGDWDTSNLGGIVTRPPRPKDIWARIRMSHGVQLSSEFLLHVLAQVEIGVTDPSLDGNPVARLNSLRADPTGQVLSMVPGFGSGHCVVPYRIEDNYGGDPNISRIWIYDNERPCARDNPTDHSCVTDAFIDIDHSANEYSFDSWNGTGMFTVPVSVFTGKHHMPGIDDFVDAIAMLFLIVAGGADAHYTTTNGEWGWRGDGTFVDNMPGMIGITPLGSPNNFTRSVPVMLSMTNPLPEIEINVRDTNTHIFHAGMGGTLLQLEMPKSATGDVSRVRLGATSNELTSFRFMPQQSMSNFIPKIGFQLSTQASVVFQWQGLAAGGGKAQEFRALKSRRAVEYCNESGKPTQHYLRVDAVEGDSSNVTCAVFGPFTVPTGAVHCVVLHDWPRSKQIRSELDLNADGVPEQITEVIGTSMDSDGDGMPDDWEMLYQLNPYAADCDDGPDADPDRDKMTNYEEYLAGTNPRDPLSALRLTATLLPDGRVRLTWPAVPGRRYELFRADEMCNLFQTVSGFPRTAASTQESYEEPTPATGNRFYRISIVP